MSKHTNRNTCRCWSMVAAMVAAALGAGCGSEIGVRELKLVSCSSDPDQIKACVKKNGELAVVGDIGTCKPDEDVLCWSQVGPAGSNGLTSVTPLAAGDALCPAGGSKVAAGVDSNDNGVLDPDEIVATTAVCNGAPGQDGSSCTVVDNNDGTKTISCEDGTSVAVSNGRDGTDGINGIDGTDGTDGVDGADGTDGVNGTSSLVRMDDEPAGSNCANGGIAVHSGLDTNGNGELEDGEISATKYVCQASTGGACNDGDVVDCYTGATETLGVGPCTGGRRRCVAGAWGPCQGEVTPSAEMCDDGIDNDCDGATDDHGMNTYYEDADGDGYGSSTAQVSLDSCQAPDGYSARSGDCDDGNAEVGPGASYHTTPLPNGSFDYNCDGGESYVSKFGTTTSGGTCGQRGFYNTCHEGWAGYGPHCGSVYSWMVCHWQKVDEDFWTGAETWCFTTDFVSRTVGCR